MRLDITDRRFRQEAQQWLARLDGATVADVQAVFTASPGYYPTTLHHLWKIELRRRGLTATCPPTRSTGGGRSVMPVAHPADYDWRFTSETARMLAARAVAELPNGAVVAHLGTPSTFLAAQESQPAYRHVLMERNQATIDALRTGNQATDADVIRVDLSAEQPPHLEAAAVILDPPWYPADTLAFLASGSLACRQGARLWLCQPTTATRPGVAAERAALLATLATLGLAYEAVWPAEVRYHTPHFEAMSLRTTLAEATVPGTWAGDLLQLRKIATVTHRAAAAGGDRSWREARFGPVRIKLRTSPDEYDLAPLLPGDVLTTVSRRDPIRDRIGVWTSGNRVLD